MISILRLTVATLAFVGTELINAQDDAGVERRLLEMAEEDPVLASALQDLAATSEARSYTPAEFLDNVEMEWLQYHVSKDGLTILGVSASGQCSVGGTLGGSVTWTANRTGVQESLSYDAELKYLDSEGLRVDVTIREGEKPPVTIEHLFEDFQAITVLLRVDDDGTRHMARYLPVVTPKETVSEFSNHLTMRLSSAVLIADGQYAGQFTVTGPVVGIASGDAGMKFELGMKPFNGAAPIGRTDGRTIRFDFDGKQYRLISTEPITVATSANAFWRVYVRGEPSPLEEGGYASHSYTYDSLIVQDALKDLVR